MRKLTETQRGMLRRLAALPPGRWELCPGGYPDAGRDASGWYRTATILHERGLAKLEGQVLTITRAGRAAVTDRWV